MCHSAIVKVHQKVFEKFLDYVQGPISHNVDSTSQIKTPGAPAGRKQTPRYFGNLQMAPPKDSITSLHSSLKTIKEKKKKTTHTAQIHPALRNFVRPYWGTFIRAFTLNTPTSLTLKYMKNPSSTVLALCLLNLDVSTGVGACLNSRFSPS